MKTFREYIEQISLSKILYHATYKPFLKSIKKNGLTPNTTKNYEDSKDNVIYLAKDKNVAESYAETSDKVPKEYLDQIVILKIKTDNLDKVKFNIDGNVKNNKGDTLEYQGVIPPKEILF
jgi:RNA:NAD 2'-phosphotransferase (TPT1/KptA family)